MSDLFERIQSDLTAKLNAEEYFSDVPVVAYLRLMTAQQDSKTETEREQPWTVKKDGAHSGVGVMVRIPTLSVQHPTLPGPQQRILIIVTVVEQPLVSEAPGGLNTSECGNKSAERVALQVAQTLHHFRYDGANILFCEGDCVRPNEQVKYLRSYDVVLRGTFYQDVQEKVGPASITLSDGFCTLACSTDGASIYYTLDGSFPSQQNASASLYTAPFAAESGTTIRAAAYKTGLIGSDVAQETA